MTIEPFRIAIPETALADLRDRIDRARWPDAETVVDESQGVPLAAARALVDRWRHGYDWRRCEAMLNGNGQYRTEIDGLGIHFLHVRSKHEHAAPLILTHGWPGSVLEFMGAIPRLTDPEAHGGTADDAFHVVIPAIPGYGFSDKPRRAGFGVPEIAACWATLMERLGYTRYFAQGGDWGSWISIALARRTTAVAGLHINLLSYIPPAPGDSPEEQRAFEIMGRIIPNGTGYSAIQSTRPQTIGYALADSPVGQAMWIYEKLCAWTDSGGHPETVLAPDAMLDAITLYWLTNSATSSARLYWESFGRMPPDPLATPIGVSIFPGELMQPPRLWAEQIFPNLAYWGTPTRGGHFAAWEQPALFVDELRACFRAMR